MRPNYDDLLAFVRGIASAGMLPEAMRETAAELVAAADDVKVGDHASVVLWVNTFGKPERTVENLVGDMQHATPWHTQDQAAGCAMDGARQVKITITAEIAN